VLLAGCGSSRTPVPSLLVPSAPGAFARVSLQNVGVSLRVPTKWTRMIHVPPLYEVFNSGPAVIALWRYRRTGAPVSDAAAAARARALLIGAARARSPTLSVIRSKLTRIGRARAVVLDATELISGRRRRVRSFHVFLPRAEIVLEEYAPASMFHAVDHAVFSPVNHSLVLLRSGA
jgi:hypothetical protein